MQYIEYILNLGFSFLRLYIIQRVFIREMANAKTKNNFHNEYKSWVLITYPDLQLDEEKLGHILLCDEKDNYTQYPIEHAPTDIVQIAEDEGRSESPHSSTEEAFSAFNY